MRPRRLFQDIPGATFERFGPGDGPPSGSFQPGDFILTHGEAFFSRLIRFGQHLRFRGSDAKYCHWNHAALVVSPDGDLIEALGSGVQRSHLSKYGPREYHLVRIDGLGDARDRAQVVAFADWCLGETYGYATIVSIALSLLTGGTFNFGFDGQMICSGLVAGALCRTDAIFTRSSSHILPADLAKYFRVEPPEGG